MSETPAWSRQEIASEFLKAKLEIGSLAFRFLFTIIFAKGDIFGLTLPFPCFMKNPT